MFNFSGREDVLRESTNYSFIDFKFTNLYGGWHHITIPQSNLNDDTFTKGIPFDGSSVPGFKSVECGDMVLLPDISTAFIDPYFAQPTLSFICTLAEADTREAFERDPRGIADKAEQYLIDSGIADESIWGPEYEFYLFNNISYASKPNMSMYYIDAPEGEWNQELHEGNFVERPGLKKGYHLIKPFDQSSDFRSEVVSQLLECGIGVNYHHHEVGGPGQNEIEVLRTTLRKAADDAMLIKYITKNAAMEQELTATFMPKPLHGAAGSGMHFHQHLFKNGQPLFFEKGNYADLSQTALYYIGGLLKHGRALLAITNPSTNSYKRLIPGFEAPVNLFFSLGNRSAAIRILKYATEPEEKRIEFRPPDATCNPYLAMAAMLMAGIDGIKNKIDPGKEGFGPFDQNIFDLTEDEKSHIVACPANLDEACDALEQDHEFLMAGGVFKEDMIRTLIKHGKKEHRDVESRPHPYEMSLYYGC